MHIVVCLQENLFFTDRVSDPLSGKVNSCLSIYYRQCCTLTCIPMAPPPLTAVMIDATQQPILSTAPPTTAPAVCIAAVRGAAYRFHADPVFYSS